MKQTKMTKAFVGCSSVFLSLAILCQIGYGIADTWRTQVDGALGTQSYVTNTTDPKYVSAYKTGDEMAAALKNYAIEEGEKGTAIIKNENSVLPLASDAQVAVFGGASYSLYMNKAGNSDAITKVTTALKNAGLTVDSEMEDIYENHIFGDNYTETTSPWAGTVRTYTYGPNTSAGDYTDFMVKEVNPSRFTEDPFNVDSDWESKVTAKDVGIVTISRPGGEGTTYKPGSAVDMDGNATGKNPLALSDDELALIDEAKKLCGKVIVLLNTSCTIEIDPLVSGDHAVDGIVYIGIPNDYQMTGVTNVLLGKVNSSGALADTYAKDSTSSPAMMNFGGYMYTNYEEVATTAGEDSRWSVDVGNDALGSFGGGASYNGGMYIVEAEGIYTGYNYYETRYYDSVLNQGNASSSAGVSQGESAWSYDDEVNYSFGYGLSYLDYDEEITNLSVEDKVNGYITATVKVTNNSSTDGRFLAQLYVNKPYTDYDKENLVEKSAIQFLTSEQVEVAANSSEEVTLQIPTKYMASFDYRKACTYIMDEGTYYFTTGNGAHDAVQNVLAAQGHADGDTGDASKVKTWEKASFDNTTYAVSASGTKITTAAANTDMNYWAGDGTVTYLSRQDWQGTYPVSYDSITLEGDKKDEWIKNLRNEQYTINTSGETENVDGIAGPKFNAESIGYEQQTNIDDPYWEELVEAIPAEEAVGAVAHGGNQSDQLTNIDNPVVVQYDGPMGFNNKTLSNNNGDSAEDDPYYVDPDSNAGKFVVNVNSVSLMGSSFSPNLAYEWGQLLGNEGLWTGCYQIWGAALNYHRTPYNGRNTEYPSEDPMLCNVIGYGIVKGSKEFGVIVGPKHIGFNDQEHNRSGISVYLNEQKMRETDLRGFEGGIEDAGALGLMVAFNRLGPVNASHHTGMMVNIIRGEWDFKGLASTDMMSNKYYFNPEGCIMATVTQMADFSANDASLSQGTDANAGKDKTWEYLSPSTVETDPDLVAAARECMKYQLYAFANSAVLNISTTRVTPWWEAALNSFIVIDWILGAGFLAASLILSFVPAKKEEEKTAEAK